METQSMMSTINLGQTITLTEVIPLVRLLPALDKLRLIRILAEELDSGEDIFPFELNKVYYLPTPYNSFGVAEMLASAMATDPKESN